MTTHVWLVRHGQTDWNVQGRLQGQIDTELDDVGLKQARAAAMHLLKIHEANPFTAIVSSDLKRTRQTAEEIGSLLGLEIRTDQRLREMHLGEFQGSTMPELLQNSDRAKQYSEFHRSEHSRAPDGESTAQVAARAVESLNEIPEQFSSERVIVVSHGGVLYHLYRYINGSKDSSSVSAPNACICSLQHNNCDWTVKQWGFTGHLDSYLENCDDQVVLDTTQLPKPRAPTTKLF